ncbi:MAG TPA: amylo-alpha-1,6-glucosidase, partial [Candidatus Limnocylindrales bacterium]|nr:amylo-alpha-1,6-glucosidase [Candidatus Limnocylindrales bacterium]
TATKPPAGRLVLVNGFDATVETSNGNYALSSQLYPPDVMHPDGARRIVEFTSEPWPKWIFALEDGAKIEQELFIVNGSSIIVLGWRLVSPTAQATLSVRPFLSGRDYHSLHHENSAFQFHPEMGDKRLVWHPYSGLPGIVALHNGAYQHQPDWYRNFVYEQERQRGLDFTEDLAAPGWFRWELDAGTAHLIFAAEGFADCDLSRERSIEQLAADWRKVEKQRRNNFLSPLDRAADSYLVKRGKGKTIVAGYPWFTDWGRDTFISLRGLCLATGQINTARDILLEWSNVVSDGMLPNLFPDQSDRPEYNSVDASLWYIVAVHDFLAASQNGNGMVTPWQKKALQKAIDAILTGYSQGTRYGIRMDQDGLLAAGVTGVQLTWMDAKVGDWVVTPRIGKPVEIQALWLNALWIGSKHNQRWNDPFARGLASFQRRFCNSQGYLYDVVDADYQAGKLDPSFRPNQIFAVGGLPLPIIDGEHAKSIVDSVERRLWTPLGLRSLAPDEPGYMPYYQGGVRERDGGYHQGTVWPWLIGPFVEAWLRVRGHGDEAKREARARFVQPLLEHLNHAGLGHVSEIADAEAPHLPRGCPFQAWSLAELLRLDRVVLGTEAAQDNLHLVALR